MTFIEIYQQQSKKVFNLCLHYVQHYEEAQEITQDVFVAIHHALENFRNESQIETWVYRIAINKCLDYIRAKNRKKRFAFFYNLTGKNESFSALTEFNHPGVALEQKESCARIFYCINQLPENQKTALILSKIEQKKQSEIAEIMNLNIKAVESLILRAKTNLSKKLLASKDINLNNV